MFSFVILMLMDVVTKSRYNKIKIWVSTTAFLVRILSIKLVRDILGQ